MDLRTKTDLLLEALHDAEMALAAAPKNTSAWRLAYRNAIEARAAYWTHTRIVFDWNHLTQRRTAATDDRTRVGSAVA